MRLIIDILYVVPWDVNGTVGVLGKSQRFTTFVLGCLHVLYMLYVVPCNVNSTVGTLGKSDLL